MWLNDHFLQFGKKSEQRQSPLHHSATIMNDKDAELEEGLLERLPADTEVVVFASQADSFGSSLELKTMADEGE
jgi:hypothetical protein